MVAVANTNTMVRPMSRILSAISFGVFWRSAPSTSLIMRSMKVEPCAAVMRTRTQSEVACVPQVTGDRSADARRRFARDRGLVDRGDALDHFAVRGDHVACFDQHDIADLEVDAG